MIDWMTALIIIVIVSAIILSFIYLSVSGILPDYLLTFKSVLTLPV